MRIIAGSARGRRIEVPAGTTTRPTSARAREATFNALYSLGAIGGATVCDLFAGSGALGLEALSRGAAHCTFVERDRAALAALRNNIDTLGFGDQAKVVAGDALGFAAGAAGFDLVLADPPYGFDAWPELLDQVSAGLLIAETGTELADHRRWRVVRQRRYASTVVSIHEPHQPHE